MDQILKVVYFGTPDFSVPTLKLLKNHPLIELVHVVSMPDRPAGRGQTLKSPEVINFAKENGIPFFQTENINKEDELLESFRQQGIDFFLVLAFAQFFGSKVLQTPKLGAFNIHTSLLPKYRGAAPIQYALLHGDKQTGVSIQDMVKEMDAGDIVCESQCEIFVYDNANSLSTRLSFLAAECTAQFIEKLANNCVTRKKQSESTLPITFAPSIKKEDGYVDFMSETASDIINKLRAFSAWPGIYTFLNGKRLKIFTVELDTKKLNAGEVVVTKEALIVGTTNHSISIHTVQLEGKKICHIKELINGLKPPYLIGKESP